MKKCSTPNEIFSNGDGATLKAFRKTGNKGSDLFRATQKLHNNGAMLNSKPVVINSQGTLFVQPRVQVETEKLSGCLHVLI